LFLLAISLPNLQLLPGRPFSLGEISLGPMPQGGSEEFPGGQVALWAVRITLGLMVLLLPISLIALVVSPEVRRRFLGDLAVLMGFFVIARLLVGAMQNPPRKELLDTPLTKDPAPELATPMPIDVYSPLNTPDWVITAISVVIALLLCGIVVAVVWSVWRRRQERPSALEQLAEEAQGAINAIQAGEELRETVLRCYRDMSRVLREERGLQRSATMTAREFEYALEKAGIPAEPVGRLTQLFEQVRYGHERLGAQEEQQAVTSLSAIVAACKPRPST
jgi:hypothetical protein